MEYLYGTKVPDLLRYPYGYLFYVLSYTLSGRYPMLALRAISLPLRSRHHYPGWYPFLATVLAPPRQASLYTPLVLLLLRVRCTPTLCMYLWYICSILPSTCITACVLWIASGTPCLVLCCYVYATTPHLVRTSGTGMP